MRLDYFIANATELSRRDAKKAISAGLVQVNEQTCRKAGAPVSPDSLITLEGDPLSLPVDRYLMLHKPKGIISATTDSQQPTALDLLPAALRRGLHIAGRLDTDTTGLLLLTTDGQWSHRITSPRVDCPKTYRVTLSAAIDTGAIVRLEQGVLLRDDPTPTKPASVCKLDERLIDLTISEGRYHQIKRMLAAVGNHVEGLHRWKIGDIVLEPELAPGQYRELTAEQVDCVA
ncbi:MAG: pseudouridine synthase [Marinobacter sp.]